MTRKKIEEKLEKDFREGIEALGYTLKYVQWIKEGQDWYLRFFIDQAEGISIEDCEKVSRYLDPLLDSYFEDRDKAYILEVSSPGLEALLRQEEDYQEAIDRFVYIKVYQKIEGQKEFSGYLRSFDKEEVRVEVEGKTLTIPRKSISLARLAIEF